MTVSPERSYTISHIEMHDGTHYDVKISYCDDNGDPIEFDPRSGLSLFDKKPALKQEFDALIRAAAQSHATKANKPLRDLKVIHLNQAGAIFNNIATSVKSHDIDLGSDQTEFLLTHYYQNYTKVNELWNKAEQILVQNYDHYQTIRNEPILEIPAILNAAPHTTIDLTLNPGGSPPPAYESHPPSPPPVSIPIDLVVPTTTDASVGVNTLDNTQIIEQETFIAGNGRYEPNPATSSHPWYSAFRHPIDTFQTWRQGPPAPPEAPINLGQLAPAFDTEALSAAREAFINAHLVETKEGFLRNTPTLKMEITNLDANINTLADAIYEESKEGGFGAILDAMNSQYELIKHTIYADILEKFLPKQNSIKGAIDHLVKILSLEFKRKLFAFLEKYYKEHKEKQNELEAAWALFNDRERNKFPTPTFTKASFNDIKRNLQPRS